MYLFYFVINTESEGEQPKKILMHKELELWLWILSLKFFFLDVGLTNDAHFDVISALSRGPSAARQRHHGLSRYFGAAIKSSAASARPFSLPLAVKV